LANRRSRCTPVWIWAKNGTHGRRMAKIVHHD
jgi:hypothetical protein